MTLHMPQYSLDIASSFPKDDARDAHGVNRDVRRTLCGDAVRIRGYLEPTV